ncbi:MAG: cytochrome c [Sneathiella sp.]|nr:cytochrome c [Sneathiella sp.]
MGFFLLTLTALTTVSSALAATTIVDRGEYLVRAGGCFSCHTDKKGGGEAFAGGRPLKTPFGTFYSPNITADKNTGIGNWSDENFLTAVKKGVRPDGSHYFPVFPFTSYTLMKDEDALAIKAYLFSLPKVAKQNQNHDVSAPFGWRWPMVFWKLLFFDKGDFTPTNSQDNEWNRGAYLVTALAHCGECHTVRNFAGAMDRSMWMAGVQDGPEGDAAPNITPAHASGIAWSVDQMAFFLKSGTKPDWERADGLMGEAVLEGYKYLTDEDIRAIARYINELPPIENYISGY